MISEYIMEHVQPKRDREPYDHLIGFGCEIIKFPMPPPICKLEINRGKKSRVRAPYNLSF
jgi:hypothetical protein